MQAASRRKRAHQSSDESAGEGEPNTDRESRLNKRRAEHDKRSLQRRAEKIIAINPQSEEAQAGIAKQARCAAGAAAMLHAI